MKSFFNTKKMALGAIIAALYAALTLFSAAFGLALGPIQIRLSEAMVVLPMFTSAAVPGLFCGCFLANLISGAHVADVIFGALATLLGAIGTRFFRTKPLLALLSPIVANGLIIPPILYGIYGFYPGAFPLLLTVFLAGEVLSAGFLGWVLYGILRRKKNLFL